MFIELEAFWLGVVDLEDRISSRAVPPPSPRPCAPSSSTRHGGPEVLTLESHWPTPTPGPGEIVVRVKRAL